MRGSGVGVEGLGSAFVGVTTLLSRVLIERHVSPV